MAAGSRRTDPPRLARRPACRRRRLGRSELELARADPRPARLRPLLSARESRRAAPSRATAPRGRAHRPPDPRVTGRRVRAVVGAVRQRAPEPCRPDLDSPRPDGTPDRGDAAHGAARTHPHRRTASGSRRSAHLPAEVREAELRVAEEVTLLWQTDEVRHDSLRVADEIRHGLWFFEFSLMSAAVELLGDWRERWPEAPPPLLFGTWIGGDLDGNPNTGPRTIAAAMARSRSVALDRYRSEVRALAVELSASRGLVDVSDELESSLVRDERGAARVRGRDRGAQHRRAVPQEAFVHVVAARQRRLRPSRRAAG